MNTLSAITVAQERVHALRRSLEAQTGAPVRLVVTHISWVLLADTLAYKLKKPVRLPFLDFGTLAARRRCCEEELRLNRRLAPSLYLDVVDVCAGPDGPAFGGSGPVLDVAVRMRRFPDGVLWSEMLAAGTLQAHHVYAMAQTLADFHRDAAVAPAASEFGSPAVQRRIARRLIDGIEAGPAAASCPDWPALRTWLECELERLAPVWEARRRAGRVRECHGDLHLANVLQLGDRASAFDGIEFDPELRWIDVLDDLAFLAMDLLANGQRGFAFRLVNAYLDAGGDHDGLPLLRFHMVCRALVRSLVMGIGARQGAQAPTPRTAGDYLAVALALSRGDDPRLAIAHGLPGSGKSFVSQALAEAVGAIRVRSDVERKRLFGIAALASSHGIVAGGIYDARTTQRTYARLAELVQPALRSGWPVIVDAAFLRREERAAFAALAVALGVPFSIVDCRAPQALMRLRLEQRSARGGDASEADVAVLERLRDAVEPLDEAERACAIAVDADAAGTPAAWARQWLQHGRERPSESAARSP